jgi:peroxiredoxin Q/BCP
MALRRRHLLWLLPGVGALALVATLGPACVKNQRLETGDVPPDLSAVDQHGQVQRLSTQRGHPLVVYFYPKDGSPGCTEQACAFRDAWKRFETAGVTVYGVSSDDAASKKKFAEEHSLPFPLLADPDHTWANAFGVSMILGYYERITFLLDREGRVAKVYPNVDPGVNATQVLEDAAKLP